MGRQPERIREVHRVAARESVEIESPASPMGSSCAKATSWWFALGSERLQMPVPILFSRSAVAILDRTSRVEA